MILFSCPKCGNQFEIEDEFAGVHAVCEVCNTRLEIPQGNGSEFVVVREVEDAEEGLEAEAPSEAAAADFESALDGQLDDLVPNQDSAAPEPLPAPDPVAMPPVNPPASGKLPPRQRRLMADWKMLTKHFSTFPLIQVKSWSGNPPERYVIAYNVKGIEGIDGEKVNYRNYHEVEIKLPGTYPRTPPICRMLTPVFHPNIEPAVICIGDHWTASERLCDLIIRIGEMIAYQAHNIKSPLDGEAAMWADLHMDELPIDSSDLTPPDL